MWPFNGCPSASSTFSSFSSNLPQPQTQLMEKLGLLWTLLLRWNCWAVCFWQPSSSSAFYLVPPREKCSAVWLFWGLLLTGDTAYGQGSQPLPASQVCDWHWCKDPAGSKLGARTACLLITSSNSVSDFSGVAPVTSVCLLSSSPFLPVVTCVSLLPFCKITQPTHLLLLFTLRIHFTATGTASLNMKMHITSPQFHQDILPSLEQDHPFLFLAAALPNARVAARPWDSSGHRRCHLVSVKHNLFKA